MSILDSIRTYKLADLEERRNRRSFEAVCTDASAAPPVRDFAGALTAAATGGGYGLIAEIKKASPSKGLIRGDFDPADLARQYEAGGAACLSVLTDGPSFRGDDSYLVAARAAVGLPVLRKDFLYDPYQVVESRALGADCILIILATLSDAQAAELESVARDWGMDALIEVHTAVEMERANRLASPLIGINNRDLDTFQTDLGTTRALARMAGAKRLVVSESGLGTPKDLAAIARYGVRCFLVGETLMREHDVETATRALLSRPWLPAAG